MKIFTELNNENKNLALALGYFDGVHLGHQKVIKSAVDFARENGKQSAVITFREHPQVFLRGCVPEYISTAEERRCRIEALGVDLCYELDFSCVLQLSGEDYIKEILVKHFAPISVSTGFNHYFGAKKSGSPELLEACAGGYGFKYFKTPPVLIDGQVVSSSLIRQNLAEGKIRFANSLLGYSFSISGVVEKGANLAGKIGFKTANITYPKELLKLPFGVYSVNVQVCGESLKGIANFGIKPTFVSMVSAPVLEVHILNFEREIYGEKIRVDFLDFIRPEKKFDSVENLIEQIKNDISYLINA